MKNVQVTVDEETLRQVDRVAKALGLKRSEIVREALRQWLRRRAVEGFEREWLAALRDRPDEPARAEDWLRSGTWSKT